MPSERLPIRIFSKREHQDERRTEGGGSGDLPPWVLGFDELTARTTEFKQALTAADQQLQQRPPNRAFIPAVMKVTLREEALAKNHRTEVGRLLYPKHTYQFIGLADDQELLLRVDTREQISTINRNLDRAGSFQVGISAVTQLELFEPVIELPTDKSTALKVKLVHYQDRRLNESVERVFEQTLLDLGIENASRSRYAPDLTIYKLREVSPDALEALQSFEALYSITPMPTFQQELDEGEPGDAIPVKLPVPGQKYPTVGILDSGIAPIPHLAPWLAPQQYAAYADDELHQNHGTFVAGIVLYGDELEGQEWIGGEGCFLLDATVYPHPRERIDEDDLFENIQNAIRQNQEVKIWNLSLGSRNESNPRTFSDFGKGLDALQDRYQVLICKSAGNCDNFTRRQPKLRIPNWADSVRALVVGSMAHKQGEFDLAAVDHPSPFSRTGFGPNNLIKPDLSHYGGNGGLRPNGRVTHTGVHSFSADGAVIQHVGTSFSTPRITALVAGLNHRLAEEFDPLLLKALVVHSAKYPISLELDPTERLKEMGFGRPGTLDSILYNSPHESTLILSDTIVRGTFIEILDFPFPNELINVDGEYFGEVIVTLVANTRLASTQGAEYCQSNIAVSFGTYSSVVSRDTTRATVLNPVGKDNPCNVLLPGNYAQRFQRHIDSEFTPERLLRSYRGKYHPVKKFAVNLSEMTQSKRRIGLQAPKRWFLRLEGLFAQAAEVAADADGEELAQDFVLIVTIRDPTGQHNVYNAVAQNLTTYNFQHSNIRLRAEVEVRVES